VITHHHSNRKGIRYLAPGLKVYHLPIVPIASQATLPQFLLFLPYFRHIMIRENIDLVHGHGTLSSLAHEAMYHSHLLGIRSVYTDHSLFGFGDAVGVLTNKLLAGALRNVDGVICVSNTGYVSSSSKGTLLMKQTGEYSPTSPTRSESRLRDPKRLDRRSIQAIPSSQQSRT
jgi:hypothetical protein